jgi:hypothetical protein
MLREACFCFNVNTGLTDTDTDPCVTPTLKKFGGAGAATNCKEANHAELSHSFWVFFLVAIETFGPTNYTGKLSWSVSVGEILTISRTPKIFSKVKGGVLKVRTQLGRELTKA